MQHMDLVFRDTHHKRFFESKVEGMSEQDSVGQPGLIAYLLSSDPITREFYDSIYHDGEIVSGCWDEGWNTRESRLVIALALACTGSLATPLAAAGTMLPCIQAAWQWSDRLEDMA